MPSYIVQCRCICLDSCRYARDQPRSRLTQAKCRPLCQACQTKSEALSPDCHSIIQTKVENLLQNGFIRPVKYPEWLANVVVVPKKGNKWRICVDYTDLNDACLKYSFPLPRIDQIVDASVGHDMLSFLDAFSGYHQILMHPSDAEKTSFITPHGLYYYNVMPFRLKKCWGHLSKVGDENVPTLTRQHYGSLSWRYAGKI